MSKRALKKYADKVERTRESRKADHLLLHCGEPKENGKQLLSSSSELPRSPKHPRLVHDVDLVDAPKELG
jgi:hypothetical protein